MKAGRLITVLLAFGAAWIVLTGRAGVELRTLRIVEPLFADPQPSPPAAAPSSAPAKPQGAPTTHDLPTFVPEHKTLTFNGATEAAVDQPEKFPVMRAPSVSVSPTGAITTNVTSDASPAAAAPASAPTADPKSAANESDSQSEPDTSRQPSASPSQPKNADLPKVIGAKNLFGAAKTPAPLAARAIGTYARGCLSGAVALPIDGPAWQEMRLSRNRNWGHPKLIALVEQFAKDAQKLDGWPGLLVGDIAQPRGGPMLTGHASHQVGLDADIWLTPMPKRRLTAKEREDIQATSMLDKTELAVDPKIFTEKQVALIKRAASYPEVERIFVHPAIKKALCSAAGTDRGWLGKVRPYFGHYYHFHVRIKCPPGFAGCTGQVPPNGEDGCGKEVDQWLAKVVPAKTVPLPPAAPGSKPSPPKTPVMLSELPNECRALLAAGPDPVPVPKEALLNPKQARQVLVKAAEAKAALAKAALTKIKVYPDTAAGRAAAAAASPALRPHLSKTVDADKK